MKIHEYQAKEMLSGYDIPVPPGEVTFTIEEALAVARKLDYYPVVLKAQIHAGGRGKGGGVRLAYSEDEIKALADSMLGMNLVTHQTGVRGQKVVKILVERGLEIKEELYLAVMQDRSTAKTVIMASRSGGVDIEEIAEQSPEKICKVWIDPLLGVQPYHLRQIAFALDLPAEARKKSGSIVSRLYDLYVDYDCSLLEINPLILTKEDQLFCMDAKINFDDNGLYRHKEILDYFDPQEEDPLETEASKYGLNYIRMDGTVGNMVNGAGLAMATMDLIKKVGASPANFLDVGGGASTEMVENGFRIILSDERVKCVLINIFGGILRCDVLAEGVVQAARKIGLNVPVVVRMEGTNVQEGREILRKSGLDLINAKDLQEAAQKVVQLVD